MTNSFLHFTERHCYQCVVEIRAISRIFFKGKYKQLLAKGTELRLANTDFYVDGRVYIFYRTRFKEVMDWLSKHSFQCF